MFSIGLRQGFYDLNLDTGAAYFLTSPDGDLKGLLSVLG